MPDTQKPRGIYLPDGTFHRFDAESLSTEVATRQNAGDIMASVSGALGILPDPDPILRARGDGPEILADLAADEQVTTAMLSRKYRVLNQQDYAFTPGTADRTEPDNAARRLCDALTRDMERWTFTDVLAGLLDAPFYGLAPLELIWKPEGGWWHLADIIPRPPEWFGFDDDNQLVWHGSNKMMAERLPPGKFVTARHFPTYKNPYGLRLLSRCLWPVAFKKGGIKFYVQFLEKYGAPWAVGMAPAKASRAEKQAMAQDLARMVQDAVAVIPAGATVQLHAASSQVGDLHERYLKRWDAAISKVLMGQTLTAELDGKGSYAAAETHKGVADDIAQADRRLVESALNDIAWLYGQINDPTTLCPVFAYQEKENLSDRADLDGKLSGLGVRFKTGHFERVYGLDPDEIDVVHPAPQSPFGGYSFSAPALAPVDPGELPEVKAALKAQTAIEGAVAKGMTAAKKSATDFCRQLEKEIGAAKDWDEARKLLKGDLKAHPEGIEKTLASMMTGAAVYGSAAVQAEIEAADDG